MSEKPLTVQQADAALADIETRRAQLAAALAKHGAELQEAEAALGEDFLCGKEDAARAVEDLRLRCDALTAALAALDKRQAVAVVNRRLAEAAELRRQAEAKRAELLELERKTAKHLMALSELEGVPYTRVILSSQRASGTWEPAVTATIRNIDYLSPAEVIRYLASYDPYEVPKSRQLFVAIQELENQAAKIDGEIAARPVEAPAAIGLKTVYAPGPPAVNPEDQFQERPNW